jgi:hypothetical protein
VTPAALSKWRDALLEGGESGLKPCSARKSVEVDRLQSKIGELAMWIKLLLEKIAHMEQIRPLANRRPRR